MKQAVLNNESIQTIAKNLRHKYGQVEQSIKSLRYGHLIIMADQDHDGSYMQLLAINSLNHFWPSLVQIKGCMHELITPIVNCANKRMDRVFYTLPKYELCRLATKMVKDVGLSIIKVSGHSQQKKQNIIFPFTDASIGLQL